MREKKIFRDLVSDVDRTNPRAIPEYLEKHFKNKEKMKKERLMMGNTDVDELQQKIDEMEEVNTANRKMVDTTEVRRQKKKILEESYI